MRLTLLFLLAALTAFGQKPRNYTDVTAELSEKIISTAGGKSKSIAVVPFTATSASIDNGTAFGQYLTETIIGSIGNQPDKIKVFERTRLDAILKEHQFILTDLMKPAAALKIGQLAPIDALLSGTYTKLKSYIDVSARLIDVESGEITVSYTGRIKMNKNIAELFAPQVFEETNPNEKPEKIDEKTSVNITFNGNNTIVNGTAAKSKADLCKQKAEEFSARLHDLSTAEKVSAVVAEAKKTPFDATCGQLHYNTMYSFTRFKIENSEYKTFLLQTLDTIAFPTGDDRAIEIVRYLASDGMVDDKEWSTSFHAMTRVGNYMMTSFASALIGKPANADLVVSKERIKQYFDAAPSKRIGLPTPISYENAFFYMIEGVKSNQALRQHVYKEYSSKLNNDDRQKATLFSTLHNMYKEETQHKSEVMSWIVDYVNKNEYQKAAEQLYDFAFDFNLTASEGRNEEIKKEYPTADLKLLVDGCAEKFSKYALQTQYESQKEDRIDFCVINGIAIPGVIPTLAEAETILKGSNLDEQSRLMDMLSLMGTKPKQLENTLVSLFTKRSLDDREKLLEIQTKAIVVLGNIGTTSSKAVDYMISTLPHYGNDTEASMIALVKIGKASVPAVVSRLEKTTEMDGGLQYQLITILGKIGKDAGPGVKTIKKILASSRNSDVKYAAEAALQNIE